METDYKNLEAEADKIQKEMTYKQAVSKDEIDQLKI